MAKSAVRGDVKKTVPVIGLDAGELPWVRSLVSLLRHPDPLVGELTRQALDYLTNSAVQRSAAEEQRLDNAS